MTPNAATLRQMERVRRCHRRLRELRALVREYALDPAVWRLPLVDQAAEFVAEALAECLDLGPDDEAPGGEG